MADANQQGEDADSKDEDRAQDGVAAHALGLVADEVALSLGGGLLGVCLGTVLVADGVGLTPGLPGLIAGREAGRRVRGRIAGHFSGLPG